MQTINHLLVEHFRCPEPETEFVFPSANQGVPGFFRLGNLVCCGRSNTPGVVQNAEEPLHDVSVETRVGPERCSVSFDPVEVVENLRRERYVSNGKSNGNWRERTSLAQSFYYLIRPLLPVLIRKHLQRHVLLPRLQTRFPKWPVDRTADQLLETLLELSIKSQGLAVVPFIWFWPEGYSAAAIMTHDVETESGLRFCSKLMDLDEKFHIPASFQIIPEERYSVPKSLLAEMRERGFEINVHDLNHDGRLYWEQQSFLDRAKKINAYGRDLRAQGFRSGALYRNLDWYDALDFAYDMSVPNVAHLDPQPGGCCTVMPFFVGRVLELPVTTTQDYPLFHILGEYSTNLWERQIQIIKAGHGLVSIIAHPDYLQEKRAQKTYMELLAHLAQLRSDESLWIALPGEISSWWRLRSRLQLVHENGDWRIEGPGAERARIAYARLDENGLHFQLPTHDGPSEAVERTVQSLA